MLRFLLCTDSVSRRTYSNSMFNFRINLTSMICSVWTIAKSIRFCSAIFRPRSSRNLWSLWALIACSHKGRSVKIQLAYSNIFSKYCLSWVKLWEQCSLLSRLTRIVDQQNTWIPFITIPCKTNLAFSNWSTSTRSEIIQTYCPDATWCIFRQLMPTHYCWSNSQERFGRYHEGHFCSWS